MAGHGSWIIPGTVPCETIKSCEPERPVDPNDPDYEDDNCVLLYSLCNYTGLNTRICADTPFTDIDYEVKSVKIPEG
jgi:hypothetical protein